MENNNKQLTRGGYPINTVPKKFKKNNGGVILIEKEYDNGKGRCEPAIILFRENGKFGSCTDAGGQQDINDIDVKYTATRELQEESANLFRINPLDLSSAHFYTIKNYTCFFVYIESINAKYYNENYNILKRNKAPQCWLETNKLHRFYVSDLIKMNLSEHSQLHVTDADGITNLLIKPRTKICISGGIEHIKTQKEYNKLNVNLDFKSNSEQFLDKTKCYYL